ncbi:LysR family transcriptional regulator [Paroceanicella profunda]|uniref:LysR family transcriptional regulator n=1 Tax=Paroceanicella profunda TaxID=2579971 RepID=A0A5B8FFU6_9RHOB|nr:LysR family transcriptional regulator [Paroceanicella profunda]QDL90391.1 LysR family transcriptional regulator [Paroceanicella profunda]
MPNLRSVLPSLNALHTFEAVARRGSFARASEELNVTPPAVSRMIARLEEYLGVTLFVREPGGVQLSAAGELLFEATARGFATIESALSELQDRRRGLETVAISVSTGFTTHWMMPRMALFKQRFPRVELRFQLIMGAISGPVSDVDFGMRFTEGPDAQHETAFIMPEILVPVCSPRYPRADRRVPLPSGSPPGPVPGENRMDWSHLFFSGPAAAEEPSAPLIFSDYAIVLQAAILGQGMALGWLNVVSHWLCTGDLVPAGEQISVTGRRCQFVNQRNRPLRPVARAVRDWMTLQLQADARQAAEKYPGLGLAAALS